MPIIGALPYNMQNGQTADASQVMADLNTIVSQVNSNGIQAPAVQSFNTRTGNVTLVSSDLTGLTMSGGTLSGTTTNSGTITGGTDNPATLTCSGNISVPQAGNYYFAGQGSAQRLVWDGTEILTYIDANNRYYMNNSGAFYIQSGSAYNTNQMSLDASGNMIVRGNFTGNGTVTTNAITCTTVNTQGNTVTAGAVNGTTITGNPVNSNGAMTATGAITGGSFVVAAGSPFGLSYSGGNYTWYETASTYWQFVGASANHNLVLNNTAQWIWRSSDLSFICSNGPIFCTAVNPSDIRLKTDISPSTYGLDAILKMNPIRYTRLPIDTRVEPDVPDEHEYKFYPELGFSAQELKDIIPEAVVPFERDKEDSMLYLNHTAVIAALVKAVQELNAKLEARG